MAQLRASGPYIWVTWLTRLLAGENSCEWASWFRAQHEGFSWKRVPDTFDMAGWQINHTAMLSEVRQKWEDEGYSVFSENQNSFVLRGREATVGGKPDLIARKGNSGVIIDVKTGKPSPSHTAQVMLYMYGVPRVLRVCPNPYKVSKNAPAPRSHGEARVLLRTAQEQGRFQVQGPPAILPWITASELRTTGGAIHLEADISDLLKGHGSGVYTIVAWGYNAEREDVVLTEYSIFHGVIPPATYN